jgi:hypothetical protein
MVILMLMELLLPLFLYKTLKEVGADVEYYIPNREPKVMA